MFAEQVIDLRTDTQLFQGKEYSEVTGRVVLHAMTPAADQARCGLGAASLGPIERPWDDSYLPHLPRCAGCAATLASAAGQPPGAARGSEVPAGLPAAGVDVRPASGSEREIAGVAALRTLIAGHDLRRWMFTDLVLVDDSIRGGFSHPLTINPDLLLGRPATALTTFLHEQLHWLQSPGLDAATTEVAQRWPDPPPLPAGGHSTESSWLHLSVCALEHRSLSEVIGPAAAAAELAQHRVYAWMYEKILADPAWFAGLLDRHALRWPDEPPVPRRYYGEEWWKNLA